MESELVSDLLSLHKGGEKSALSHSEIFYEHFPYYLAMGMTKDEYWNGNAYLAEAYRKAYSLKQKDVNQQAWLQGAYFYEALLDAAPVINALSKKTEPFPYKSEPYSLEKQKKKTQAEIERENQRAKYNSMLEQMKLWAAQSKNKT